MPITNHEVAVKLGATPDASGGYLGSEYISRGIPLFAGCEGCGATLAPYNSYPSLSGYLRCSDCIGDAGFDTWDDYVAHYGALGIDVTAQPQEERAWWTRPCEYGHQECSFRRDGPCGDEHNHPDPDLEWREPLGGQEMP